MRKHIALGTVLALGLGGQALAAEGFSYSNIEAAYVDASLDAGGGDLNGDGFSISGSAAFTENLFGFGNFGSLDFDGAKLKPLTLGVGFHWPLGASLDFVSGLSYERLKVAGLSDNGYGLTVGLRGRVGDRLELTGNLKHIDVGDYGTDFTFNVGGRYYFTDAFAVGIDFTKWDDLKLDTWAISVRYDFGRR